RFPCDSELRGDIGGRNAFDQQRAGADHDGRRREARAEVARSAVRELCAGRACVDREVDQERVLAEGCDRYAHAAPVGSPAAKRPSRTARAIASADGVSPCTQRVSTLPDDASAMAWRAHAAGSVMSAPGWPRGTSVPAASYPRSAKPSRA